jgi:TrmH family RNA methyltransferase
VGGEADGASQNARELAKCVVNIPMPGKIESLNAGVAGAVLMFEVVRQRSEACQRQQTMDNMPVIIQVEDTL